LNDVATDSPTVEDIEFGESLKRERSVRIVERRSDSAVIAGGAKARISLTASGTHGIFSRAHRGFGALEICAPFVSLAYRAIRSHCGQS
jgi:hypothetical protein